ncbi:CYTH and CHAD domain-containing protein [Streptomyces sp. NBC_01005]|uniref:CYTH and CHAD domain-containing protein n=1 Tax=unclassified Streptomyces TaxID=2593676 RepID=UPI0038699389|nr:CYTH and CHAD domain-containing protein [Streptomyces sp. NBC_01005]WTC97399.1 CYTH and CHAD domain-containing protein [Streptomyces sp. NBC_01650]
MADSKREIERKYAATAATRLPDLSRVAGVFAVAHRGVSELDAVYYDTEDLRLAADSLTLRRRTGGSDAGWHLKFPVASGIRDELREPLSDALPRSFAGLLRSRVRDRALVPVVRLVSARDVHHLLDAEGALLAEVSVDRVRAERLTGGAGTAAWTEIEAELADDGDPAFLDAVERRLRKAGIRPSESPSKLSRALAETAPKRRKSRAGREEAPTGRKKSPAGKPRGKPTAGDHVLAYVRRQAEAIVALDPAVRRDLPDSVHQLRVATRRLRSALRTYRKILDRDVTDPVGAELKWLAAELGIDRDQEVLDARLRSGLDALPRTLALGPVRGRLRIWSVARRNGSRRRTVALLDGKRYLALLESLDALLAAPPLLPAASRAPERALPRAVLKEYRRLATRIGHALELPPGHGRDLAVHEARKAAKRVRYAAEATRPALGRPAKRFAKRMKAVQSLLGDHQDSVVTREALRTLAVQAHAAGEPAFTWGLLYGREEAAAAARERELPEIWERASRAELRAALGG